ncbi:MAG: hypothetical protein KA746_17510 [Pyrinomonadaceae bacterium]|nr:hypothetical protein [Pyrinomonadaceae bacterium]MBP6212012.1 hypothetical protein [Pyrinomonadaceae bacterium]
MKFKTIVIPTLLIAVGVSLAYFVPRSTANDITESVLTPSNIGTTVRYTEDRFALAPLTWQTIVNNSFSMPNSDRTYSSYGQPSVNSNGMVVFRARSTGSGQRMTGIYSRQFPKGPVREVADLSTFVPYPNNLETMFQEFSAIPRIAANSDYIATRGNHKPVYKYLLPDGTETRTGTTGIYVQFNGGLLFNGTSKIGLAPGFENHAVPNTDPLVAFDVYPGAPAITDNGTIAFKGNFTIDGVGKTGIFYRELISAPGGGKTSVEMVASSDTEIPNAPPSYRLMSFGSTAPPSVSGDQLVFVGLDNEENPNYGGIYLAPISPSPKLRTLVGVGEPLPGTKFDALTRIGEGLAFDGRYVAFWGAWSYEMKTVRLFCPEDGNADIIAYCNGVDPNSIFDAESGRWYQDKQVNVDQGIFIFDIYANHAYLVSHTNGDFNDFMFWGYSGRPPGVGSETEEVAEEDGEEPPRWRSAAFIAASDGMVVFKARTGAQTPQGEYISPIDGIYMRNALAPSPIQVLVETGMNSDVLDPSIPGGVLPIIGVGIERDGFRGNKLAITASMADSENGWGGIYMTNINRGPAVGLFDVKTAR